MRTNQQTILVFKLVYRDKLKVLSPDTLNKNSSGPGLGQVLLLYGQQCL